VAAKNNYIKDREFWIDKALPTIMEYGIYILVIFLFTDKREAFRSIGIYIPPVILAVRTYLLKELPFNWKDPIFILICALCLSAIVASIFAPIPYESFRWFKKTYLKLFLVFIVVAYIFKHPDLLRKLGILFSILGVLFTIFTFYDYATKAILPNGNVDFGSTIRKYINPLEVFLPFIPFAFISTSRKLIKGLWVIALFAGLIAVLLTGARGGWVSIGISLIIWIVGYYYLTGKRITSFLPYIVGAIIGIFLILNIIPSSHIYSRIKQGFDTSNRLEMVWPVAIDNYSKLSFTHKIIGNGISRTTYLNDFREWYLQKYGSYPTPEATLPPHNIYLYTLYKQGIIGLLLLLAMIIVSLKYMLLRLTGNYSLQMKFFGLSILSCLVGSYVIHGLVEDVYFKQFILIISVVGAFLNAAQQEEIER
jgi:O-antigen ligase